MHRIGEIVTIENKRYALLHQGFEELDSSVVGMADGVFRAMAAVGGNELPVSWLAARTVHLDPAARQRVLVQLDFLGYQPPKLPVAVVCPYCREGKFHCIHRLSASTLQVESVSCLADQFYPYTPPLAEMANKQFSDERRSRRSGTFNYPAWLSQHSTEEINRRRHGQPAPELPPDWRTFPGTHGRG
jgi:hypothetical protein